MQATAGKAVPKIEPTIGGSVYVKPNDIKWEPTQFQGISIKVLYEDKAKGEMTCLLKWEPGATLPMHKHPEIDEAANVLQVTLPTNFKVARFASDAHTAMLRRMQADIEAARYDAGSGPIDLPVKLKVHDSVFVPLAKWSMLLAGNYRCVQSDAARSIQEAVHSDIAASRSIYDGVRDLCIGLGASPGDLVPFEKYAAAAQGLRRPSSAARALFAGALNIERVDRLVQGIAAQMGRRSAALDEIVELVDARLAVNRRKVA
jgi:hypothetical protein